MGLADIAFVNQRSTGDMYAWAANDEMMDLQVICAWSLKALILLPCRWLAARRICRVHCVIW